MRYQRHTKALVGALLTAAGVSIGAVIIGMVAPASALLGDGNDEVQTEGEGGFYSLNYTLERWQQLGPVVNARYPLPDGREFPESTAMLEVPSDGEIYRFQDGMAEQLIAQYWHCAWIDAAVSSSEAGDVAAASVAAATALKWTELPSVGTQPENRSSATKSAMAANAERGAAQPWWVDEKSLVCGSMAEVSK